MLMLYDVQSVKFSIFCAVDNGVKKRGMVVQTYVWKVEGKSKSPFTWQTVGVDLPSVNS